MYSLDHSVDVSERELDVRDYLREAQRQLHPAQVARRREGLRRLLAECVIAEPPPDPRPLCLQPEAQVG